MPAPDRAQFTEFVTDVEPSVRRALCDELGPEVGREATADALAFAWANWDRVATADDATAYLVQVGRTAAERHPPLGTGDVVPILPRSATAFDAVVPPVTAEAAIARASDLADGAPTTLLARPGAPTTVMSTTMLTTPPTGPSPRAGRPWLWGFALVIVGIIALGGIALAARDDGDGVDSVETSPLPTLPTTVAPPTTVPVVVPTAPPTTALVTTTENTTEITAPDDDDDDDDGTTRPPTTSGTRPPATTTRPVTTPSATTNPPTTSGTTSPSTTDAPTTTTGAPATTASPVPTITLTTPPTTA